jgi:hypothetical protein
VYDMPLGHTGRSRQTWIGYEVVKPDYELVLLQSPIASLGSVDVTDMVRRAGALLIGKLVFLPVDRADVPGGGFMTLATSIPLQLLADDAGGPATLFHLTILANAAAELDRTSAGVG